MKSINSNTAALPEISHQIKNRWTGGVIFECDLPGDTPIGMVVRMALEKAIAARADLRNCDLRFSDLRNCDLRGAVLSFSDLRNCDLRGAVLSNAVLSNCELSNAVLSFSDLRNCDLRNAVLHFAYLTGAVLMGADPILRATPEQSIENLDKVRAIILSDKERLEMSHWHGGTDWVGRTCAEETLCGTTHCLAGWLQVCSTNPEIRKMDAELAGILSAPVARKMFFREADEVMEWLEKRAYVDEAKGDAQ
jgi:hypothetical protein